MAALSIVQLRRLLLHLQVPVTGRVTKVDLQYSLCQKLKISTAGECSTGFASIERATIPPEVLPAYRRLESLAELGTSNAPWWTQDLRKVAVGFCRQKLVEYLIFSPDKQFDGDSLRSYKALRAYKRRF